MSTLFISIYSIDKDTIRCYHSGQECTGIYGNKGLIRIPEISSISRASPSDCLVSYPEHWLREYYASAEMHSVYFTATADFGLSQKT